MKKSLQIFSAVFLLILIYISVSLLPPAVNKTVFESPLYSDTIPVYEISGCVFYKESVQPVRSGYVKAFIFNWEKDIMITIDSVSIQDDGIYTLRRCTNDSLFIMAYGNDEFEDFMPGYYDTTIHWQSSKILTPSANISNANINVNRKIEQENGTHHISGRIFKEPSKPDAIENAIIYAKVGAKFKGYGISDKLGNYHIDSLPPGDFEIIAERIGYYNDYRYIQIGQFNTDTINFYLARVSSIGPPEKRIPKEFALYNNYPNPFNPLTKIKFEVPASNLTLSGAKGPFVRLIIYDILGREIAKLINEQLTPGTYEIEWDGTNYPSGVYFYKLITAEFIETRKMVLIK